MFPIVFRNTWFILFNVYFIHIYDGSSETYPQSYNKHYSKDYESQTFSLLGESLLDSCNISPAAK